MKIAIIGSGISGLTAAYYLHQKHDVTVFEKESWIGGHTHTVEFDGQHIDTGFIVFNDRTYPYFKSLLEKINVPYRKTEMSFSVRNDACKLEYNGSGLNSLFADRRNFFRPKFYKLIADILKFNKLLKSHHYNPDQTLGEFVTKHKFNDWFVNSYILPMGSAIWSMGISDMIDFPIEFFARFFLNHGLLDIVNRPQWFTVVGGSYRYIEPLTKGFKHNILINTPVIKVERKNNSVDIITNDNVYNFDKVIFACHCDQALALLAKPTQLEIDILGDMKFSNNEVILHNDTSILPKKKLAHASWNYLISNNSNLQPTLTYNMNILQGLNTQQIYCVTLNSTSLINKDKILAKFNYSHPIFSKNAIVAQSRYDEISGLNNTYYCGAYWGNGFHEDGVYSAIRVCLAMGEIIV